MNNNENKTILISVIAFLGIIAVAIITIFVSLLNNSNFLSPKKELSALLKKIPVYESQPVKAPVNLSDASLYDELPDIDKYQLVVRGTGDIDIEIFSSPEKAEDGTDGWLADCAKNFNKSNITTAGGKTVSISVRDISSGIAADYIISEKYLPECYSPSNYLWGEYINYLNHDKVSLVTDRLVGNTAGFLVKPSSGYKDCQSVIRDVKSGTINLGYTNPQVSSAGMNLLLTILTDADKNDITSDAAKEAFATFQNNIPYVAYNTVQMKESATGGSLDSMIMEGQSYLSDKNLNKNYDFIPYGIRHDNPLYVVNESSKTDEEKEAINLIKDYLLGDQCQKLATKYGFNAYEDYTNAYDAVGLDVVNGLNIYKTEKDSGKDIIAVFVADCSGSMDGDPINELKQSLSNGMQYINENNYVGLVSYSTNVHIDVPIGKFDLTQKSYFQGAINNLNAGGSTYSYEAVAVALDMIEKAKTDHPDAKCMLFLLSDGYANGKLNIRDVTYAVQESGVPIYSIGYTSEADMDALKELSGINEAATINADSDDIVYKIKSLFNAQL